MEKYTIKELYGTDELPKLFCEKGTILRLRRDVTLSRYKSEDNLEVEKGSRVVKNTLFKVKNIVGYGFDLISLDSQKIEARFINSSMPEYFEIVTTEA